ncbi:MAG: glutamyl-tRNA amidotransferase [Merismopedia sp. SIO2A8]|nr:glutamyl-tRNA amidotransferase [Symploca sp. SIO2B6]NET52054.1 glutamyl-tRNA amidotransferase [Merismopedia sp. SIO2A8]
MSDTIKLAVNGTLMQGLALNPNLLNVGATFEREAKTEPAYRLWTIDDRYPAMIKVNKGGRAIALEVWQVPLAGLGIILTQEPPGLAIGKVQLEDGEEVLGVIGEPLTVEGKTEITEYGGWRSYQAARSDAP